MTKRAFIIYGWDGYPDEGWFPWLKTELEKNGFQVLVAKQFSDIWKVYPPTRK